MSYFAGPELAIAVSKAGGLGLVGGYSYSIEELTQGIDQIRSETDRPFGVNLLFGGDIRKPCGPGQIAVDTLNAVNAALNPIRSEIDLPPSSDLPTPPSGDTDAKLDALLERKVPVISFGLGDPGAEVVAKCHAAGSFVIAMVSSVEDGLAVAKSGAGAIVAQGSEAGGHRSHFVTPERADDGLTGTMALVPALVDAVRVPVIAAGGISDGKGIAAALTLGAQAALLGTRFLATAESRAVAAYKQALLSASSRDTTVSKAASGRYARLIRNRFLDAYPGSAPTLPYGWHGSAVAPIFDAARSREDAQYMALWAGQSVDGIHDLPPAAELMKRLVAETREALELQR